MRLIGLTILVLCSYLAGYCQETPPAGERRILELQVHFEQATPFSKLIYGFNNEWVHLPYTPATPQFIERYRDLGSPTFRYPAGTASNYLDMNTGFAKGWPGMAPGNAQRVVDNNRTLQRLGKERGVDLQNYIHFLKQTNATSNYILNVSSMTIKQNHQVLTKIREAGVSIQHFEVGNELYHGTYATAFPSPEDYLDKARQVSQMVKSVFPKAKVAVVAHPYFFVDEMNIDGLRTSSKRLRNWYDVLKSEDFFDAVAVHMYAYTGMDARTEELLPYHEVYANACMNADQTADSTLERLASDFPGKELWVTEYHVGGFSTNLRRYRLRYSYLGALYNTGFMLRLFSHPEVTLSNWHAIPQWLDPVIKERSKSMQDSDTFNTRVTYDFFKQFRDPVMTASEFVPVVIKGSTLLENSNGFNEFQAGIFLNPETGIGFLMILNKQANDHILKTSILEKTIGGTLVSATSLCPSPDLPINKALASEDKLLQSELDSKAELIPIKAYSVNVIRFQRN